jgi:hypothetical protein
MRAQPRSAITAVIVDRDAGTSRAWSASFDVLYAKLTDVGSARASRRTIANFLKMSEGTQRRERGSLDRLSSASTASELTWGVRIGRDDREVEIGGPDKSTED